MEKKLERLKDRLSDLSKRNRSLRLLKLFDKWTFDLAQLGSEEILSKLLHNQSIHLVSTQSEDEVEQRQAHKLLSLYRNVTALEEETGLYNVFVGYPFITGRLSDDTYIQAPVFLFPVRLERKSNRQPGWALNVIADEEVIINRTLLLALKKYGQITVDEQIFEDAKQIPTSDFAAWVCELLNQYGIKCNLSKDKLTPLPQYTQNEIPNSPKGRLEIRNHTVLGHFPQGNSAILKDYEELLELLNDDGDLGLVSDLLLQEEENSSQPEGVWDVPIDIDSVPQKKIFNILDMDTSQEEVLHSVESQKGLVVHGPPGTGKSQVIVNLITNALASDQKVLVVCQKRAALEVVYQRLDANALSSQVAQVHDPVLDRKGLYQKINRIMEGQSQNAATREETDYQETCQELDRKTKYFNRIADGLWIKQPCGLSAFELFSRSKSVSADEVLLNLGSLPEQVDYPKLLKMLPTIKRLGNYFGKYGHERYSWVDRQSFAKMDNTLLYTLRQLLTKAISQSENALKQKALTGSFNPGECWMNEEKLAKGIRSIERHNSKAILSNISLWFWTKFSGKEIVAKLSGQASLAGFQSEQWKGIEKAIAQVYKYGADTRSLNDTIKSLAKFLKANDIAELVNSLKSGEIPLDRFKQLQQDLEEDFDQLVEMDSIINQLEDTEAELLAILLRDLPVIPNSTLGTLWQGVVEKSFYTRWIDTVEKSSPEIKHLSTGKFDETLKEYKSLLRVKRELTPKLLNLKLQQKVVAFRQTSPRDFRELLHQVGKMRRVWPVRKLVAEFAAKGLLDVIPVWLVSPETVSTVFPLIKGMFDLVIFDEASQCLVENGVPAFYRAKKIVVAGDEKQLPPFDLFRVTAQDQDEDENMDGIEDSDSLLNLSKRCYQTKLLAWHYRSKHEELINFSNHALYGGQVQIAPNVTPYADPPAIEWISVDGLWESNCNEQEAKQVVAILKQIFSTYPDKTVGVITFNSKQQEKIQDYIEQLAEADLEFNSLYHQVMARDIDSRLFVKNIENVQGDERDIIIFSIAYGRNVQGRVSVNFGTLNRQGGENRLNVAVSRGKEKIIVVASIKPEDLDVSNSKNLGPVLFKQYLRYAYAVAHKDRETLLQVLQEVNQSLQTGQSERGALGFDSPFEEEVYQYLTAQGYQVDAQIGCSGYRIDLAVVHPQDSSRYILGIECDGAMYHSAKSARERDVYRQRFLETKGWTIARIWSRNWWQNAGKEINRIETLIQELGAKQNKSEFQVISATGGDSAIKSQRPTPQNSVSDHTKDLRKKPNKGSNQQSKIIRVEPKQQVSGKKAEVITLQPRYDTAKGKVDGNSGGVSVGYGDRITIEDLKTRDQFEVDMEKNPYNRHLMSDIQKSLLGRNEGDSLSFSGSKYKIVKIDKSPETKEKTKSVKFNDELY